MQPEVKFGPRAFDEDIVEDWVMKACALRRVVQTHEPNVTERLADGSSDTEAR